MTAIDPALERHSSGLSAGDECEREMLRHDVKAAFAGIAGGIAQIMQMNADPDLRAQIERVAASAKDLELLVEIILGSEAAASPPVVDVDRLMSHLRHRFTGEAQEFGLAFRVEMDPALPSQIPADPVTLFRILENLVRRAMAGKVGGALLLAATKEQGEIVFRVNCERTGRVTGDSGSILPSSDQVIRSLAARLGASLQLAEGASQPTLSVLRLPVAANGAGSGAAPAAALAGVRVLLAEDNPTNQMVASNMLRSLGADVVVCSDGVEALERFETFIADLVIVDIEMPRMTGLDVIRAIRARTDARAHVPIVALTAYAMHEHRDRITSAGANGLIPKPISSIDSFGRTLATHVRRPEPSTAFVRAAMETAAIETAASGPSAQAVPPVDDTPTPVIDQAIFDDLCRTIGPELVGELMDKVVSDLVGSGEKLREALAPLDCAQIERTSHILISVAGAFGATRLQKRARSLNTRVLKGEARREDIAQEVVLCIAEIDAAARFARARAIKA